MAPDEIKRIEDRLDRFEEAISKQFEDINDKLLDLLLWRAGFMGRLAGIAFVCGVMATTLALFLNQTFFAPL